MLDRTTGRSRARRGRSAPATQKTAATAATAMLTKLCSRMSTTAATVTTTPNIDMRRIPTVNPATANARLTRTIVIQVNQLAALGSDATMLAPAAATAATCSPNTTPACCLCDARSEEHTSDLQSRENIVCRLLLEKKK